VEKTPRKLFSYFHLQRSLSVPMFLPKQRVRRSTSMAKAGALPEELLPLKELADALQRPLDRPVLSEFLTAKELAAELRLNRRTVDRWHRIGTGPPRTLVGRMVMYRRDAVRKWLAEQEQQSGVNNYTGKRRGRRPRADG
jgi:hypothetical protein